MINQVNTSLRFNDVFKKDNTRYRLYRTGAVITSKQMVFYIQLEPEKSINGNYYPTHWGIVDLLHKEIDPYTNKQFGSGDDANDIHLFSWDNSLTIDLPNSGHLSKMQSFFLIDILNQIEMVNNEIEDNNKKICVGFYTYNTRYEDTFFDPYDIQKMKRAIKNLVTSNICLEKEKIVGETLSDDIIIRSITYHIDPSKYHSSIDLINYKKILETFYEDDYFNKYLLMVIPNYEIIIKLIEIIGIYDVELPLIRLETLENDLKNIIFSLDQEEIIENNFKRK